MDIGSTILFLLLAAYMMWSMRNADRGTIINAIIGLLIITVIFWVFDAGWRAWEGVE